MSSISTTDIQVENSLELKGVSSVPNEYVPGYQKASNYQEPASEGDGRSGGYRIGGDEIYDRPLGKQTANIDSKKCQLFPKIASIVAAVVIIVLLLLVIVAFILLGILSGRMSDVESDNDGLRSLLSDMRHLDNDNIDDDDSETADNDDAADNSTSGESPDFSAMERRIQENLTRILNNQIESVVETVNALDTDVQHVNSRLNDLENGHNFDNPVDGKTAEDLLREAGVNDTERYVNEFGYIKIQERTSSSLSFYRNLTEYKNGFNDSENFWIGLDVIHKLTSQYTWILRIETEVSSTGHLAIGQYYRFRVASEDEDYRFNIDYEIASLFGSDLLQLNARPFEALVSTSTSYPCSGSYRYRAGWWYPSSGCGTINLNAPIPGQTYSSTSYMAKVSSSTYVKATTMLLKRA